MNTTIDTTDWLTTAQAARRLGVTPAWIRALMKKDRVRYVSTQLGRLIDPASIEIIGATRQAANGTTLVTH